MVAILLAGSALIWTALQRSGVHASDWYISSCLIGFGLIFVAASGPEHQLRPFSRRLRVLTIATGVYIVFQLLPLPANVLRIIAPARASLLDVSARVIAAAKFAPIAVDEPAAILWTATLFGSAALFFIVRCFTGTFRDRPWLALLPLFSIAVIEAALGVLQLANGGPYIIGTYNSRDHYAFLLEITVPLFAAAGLVSIRQGRVEREFTFGRAAITCISWCLAVLLVAVIFSSLSRTGSFGALVGLAAFVSLALGPSLRSRRMRAGFIAILSITIGFALFAFTPRALLQRLFETAGAEPDVRLSFWRESLPLLARFPIFGIGLMGYESSFLRYQSVILLKRVDFAHNDYLQYLIELGVIGFALAALALGGVMWPAVKGAWASRDGEARIWLTGCTGSLVAVAVHSFVDFNLYVPANVLAFAWIAAFGSAIASEPPARSPVRA